MQSNVLGIDCGTSGVRIAIINNKEKLIYSDSQKYSTGLEFSEDWESCIRSLIQNIPKELKKTIFSLAIDGTSGTLVACDYDGNTLGSAIPYHVNCEEQKKKLDIILKNNNFAGSLNNSLAKALRLSQIYGDKILLRHQADWISGWFLNDWKFGEEGNNIRLGWDLLNERWPPSFGNLLWKSALPLIKKSGTVLGLISSKKAEELNLPKSLLIVAGTTDSNASVLASNAKEKDGITVLGSTLVVKKFINKPIFEEGVTNHRVFGKWLIGGASNSGGVVLKKFFDDNQIKDLSNQIDPEINSGLFFRPLPSKGERFPINEPNLEPIMSPRPISDCLYLQGILEGIAKVELECWIKLQKFGVPFPNKIITIGGGAKNPTWRRIRERTIGIPIKTCSNPPAFGVARIALKVMNQGKSNL